MTSVPGLAIAVNPARTGGIGDTELVGVEEKRVGISDVQLLLFPHQPALFAGYSLHQPLAKRRGEIVIFFGSKMGSKGIFSAKPVHVAFMAMLFKLAPLPPT